MLALKGGDPPVDFLCTFVKPYIVPGFDLVGDKLLHVEKDIDISINVLSVSTSSSDFLFSLYINFFKLS